MKLLKRLFTSWINIVLILAIIVVGIVAVTTTFGGEKVELFTVAEGSVVQEVTVTGRTEPAQQVDLAFEQSGRVTAVTVAPGSVVPQGAVISRLDAGELAGQLRQAQARVSAELARLSELRRGARPEELRIAEAAVAAAEVSLLNARRDLEAEIQNAATAADDALRTHADKLFDSNMEFGISLRDETAGSGTRIFLSGSPSEQNLLDDGRADSDREVEKLRDLNIGTDVLEASRSAEVSLEVIARFFTDLALVVSGFSNDNLKYRSQIENYRNIVSAGRTQVTAAQSALRAAERSYRNAAAALDASRRELDLKRAGATAESLALQQASVDQARGGLDVARAQYGRSVMVAPFAGRVAKVSAKVGDMVTVGKTAVTLISDGGWQIEASVSEVDIGRIKIGNPVLITIDALPAKEFAGRVVEVDTAETIVDGVVNYGVKVMVTGDTQELKSGMTANLKIQTEVKTRVLVLPETALDERDQGTFVLRREGGTVREVKVVTGIRGRDGLVEIISGLKVGDQVENVGLKTND